MLQFARMWLYNLSIKNSIVMIFESIIDLRRHLQNWMTLKIFNFLNTARMFFDALIWFLFIMSQSFWRFDQNFFLRNILISLWSFIVLMSFSIVLFHILKQIEIVSRAKYDQSKMMFFVSWANWRNYQWINSFDNSNTYWVNSNLWKTCFKFIKRRFLQRILIQVAKYDLMSSIYDRLSLHYNFTSMKNIHASLKCDFAL